jgi:hypothetical protein
MMNSWTCCRAARQQAQDDEHDDRHAEHDEDRLDYAAGNVGNHGRS